MNDDAPLLDTTTLDNLIAATSREFAQELIVIFHTVNTSALDDLDAAITAGDFVEARRIAHKSRSAANLGATRFSDLARRMEELPSDADDSEFTSLQADLRTTFTATETALSQHLSDTP